MIHSGCPREKRRLFSLFSLSCCCSVTKLCPTLWGPMDCRMLGFPVLHYLPEFVKFMFIESVKPSKYLILCHHLLLLPSIYPSIRIFSNELALRITWPKYWSFSSSLPKEYSGLISFRIDGFDLHAVQGLSRVFSSTTTQKHQFYNAQTLWSNSHIHTWLLGKW